MVLFEDGEINDTVPAMLTPGEVVISKPAAQKFGGRFIAINVKGSL